MSEDLRRAAECMRTAASVIEQSVNKMIAALQQHEVFSEEMQKRIEALNTEPVVVQPSGHIHPLNLPTPIEFTLKEGGRWFSWEKGCRTTIHSIKFSDGRIFDATVGWREP